MSKFVEFNLMPFIDFYYMNRKSKFPYRIAIFLLYVRICVIILQEYVYEPRKNLYIYYVLTLDFCAVPMPRRSYRIYGSHNVRV